MPALPKPPLTGAEAQTLHATLTACALDELPTDVAHAVAAYERLVVQRPAMPEPRRMHEVLADVGAAIWTDASTGTLDPASVDLADIAAAQVYAAQSEALAAALSWARAHAEGALLQLVRTNLDGVMQAAKARHADLVARLAEVAQRLDPDITDQQALTSDATRQDYTTASGLVAALERLHSLAALIANEPGHRAEWGKLLEYTSTRAVADVHSSRMRALGEPSKWGPIGSLGFWLHLVRGVPLANIWLATGAEQASRAAELWPPRGQRPATEDQRAVAYTASQASRV